MAVLNVKEVFPVMERLSMLLSCRIRPVPVRPVTVPPTVNVVEPPPPPPPLLDFRKLQAARNNVMVIKDAKRTGFRAGFISFVLSLLFRL